MKNKQTSLIIALIAIIAFAITACNEPNPPPVEKDTVATPTATPSGGQVADNTAITLATTTAGAAIYYTQDNTEPTVASTLYGDGNKPVITTGKLTLKAIAVKEGMNNSEVMTATYTIVTVTPPTVTITNANQTKTLAPDLEIELSATVTQGTNPIQSKEWTLKNATVEGVTPVFADKTAATTTVTGIKKAGTFVFELKVKDTTGVEGTAEATVVVEAGLATETIIVAEVSSITFPTDSLPLETANNFTFAIPSSYFSNVDFADISYKLSAGGIGESTINDAISNGMLGKVAAFGSSTSSSIITQTFYYKGEVVGIRKFQVRLDLAQFSRIYEVKSDNSIGSRIDKIPSTTLTLSKTITEILPPPEENEE